MVTNLRSASGAMRDAEGGGSGRPVLTARSIMYAWLIWLRHLAPAGGHAPPERLARAYARSLPARIGTPFTWFAHVRRCGIESAVATALGRRATVGKQDVHRVGPGRFK